MQDGTWTLGFGTTVSGSQENTTMLQTLCPAIFTYRTNPDKLPASFFSFTGSLQIQDSSPAQQDCLVADLSASALAHERAVQGGAHANQDLSWQQLIKYCHSIGLDSDIFLNRFEREHQIKIIGAFSVSMRDGCFSNST